MFKNLIKERKQKFGLSRTKQAGIRGSTISPPLVTRKGDPKMSNDSLTMTIPEVAKALGISRGLCYALAKKDSLPVNVLRLGNRRMVVPRRALEDLLSSKPNEKVDQK